MRKGRRVVLAAEEEGVVTEILWMICLGVNFIGGMCIFEGIVIWWGTGEYS